MSMSTAQEKMLNAIGAGLGAGGFVAKGYAQITSLSAAAGFASVPVGATKALIEAQDQTVRWRDDGTNPTATVGMQLFPGMPFLYDGSDLTAIKFIQETASAKLNVSFYA